MSNPTCERFDSLDPVYHTAAGVMLEVARIGIIRDNVERILNTPLALEKGTEFKLQLIDRLLRSIAADALNQYADYITGARVEGDHVPGTPEYEARQVKLKEQEAKDFQTVQKALASMDINTIQDITKS